jgi:hypothetical protein
MTDLQTDSGSPLRLISLMPNVPKTSSVPSLRTMTPKPSSSQVPVDVGCCEE